MKYISPEYELYEVESQDVIAASAQIDASDDKTDVVVGADDILNRIF